MPRKLRTNFTQEILLFHNIATKSQRKRWNTIFQGKHERENVFNSCQRVRKGQNRTLRCNVNMNSQSFATKYLDIAWLYMADFGLFTNLFLRNCKHHSIHWPSNSLTEIGSGETLTGNVSLSSKTFGWSARNWRSESKVWRFSSFVNSTLMVLSLSYRLQSPLIFHTTPCNSFLYHLCHPHKTLAINRSVTWKSCQWHYGWYIIHFSHTIRNEIVRHVLRLSTKQQYASMTALLLQLKHNLKL